MLMMKVHYEKQIGSSAIELTCCKEILTSVRTSSQDKNESDLLLTRSFDSSNNENELCITDGYTSCRCSKHAFICRTLFFPIYMFLPLLIRLMGNFTTQNYIY